jgi:hypothetical protein
MSTAETTLSDLDSRLAMEALAKGQPIPPDIAKRIHDAAEAIRKEIVETQGIRSTGVEIIRELRGALPEA